MLWVEIFIKSALNNSASELHPLRILFLCRGYAVYAFSATEFSFSVKKRFHLFFPLQNNRTEKYIPHRKFYLKIRVYLFYQSILTFFREIKMLQSYKNINQCSVNSIFIR